MKRKTWAFLLIFFGFIWLIKDLDLLPISLLTGYLKLASCYWPIVLVLIGIGFVFQDQLLINKLVNWISIILIGIWIIAWLWGQPQWII